MKVKQLASVEDFNEYLLRDKKISLNNTSIENYIKNKDLKTLQSVIFPHEITLIWENTTYEKDLEFDLESLKEHVGTLYGDKIRFVNIRNINENLKEMTYEITIHVSGPVTAEKLLKEMGRLGNNFPEPGIFYGLTHKSDNKYVIDWTR